MKKLINNLLAQGGAFLRWAFGPSTRKRLLLFLSHSAWQGIGSLIGLLSLIVSVILSIYIFRLTERQQYANIRKIVGIEKILSNNITEVGVEIQNRGPQSAENVFIRIVNLDSHVKCKVSASIIGVEITEVTNIAGDQALEADYFCTFKLERFYAGQWLKLSVQTGIFEQNFVVFVDGLNVREESGK